MPDTPADETGSLGRVASASGFETQRLRQRVRASLMGGGDAPTKLGRFEILAPIGEGGMGMVYRAFDPELERTVALKVLRHLAHQEEFVARLRAEARALAKLSHPNVLTLFEVGVDDGTAYLALEYIEGANLREWLRSHDSPGDARVELMIQAARGLAAAHEAGIVHRDLKPSNLLVAQDGRVRVADFGLARARASSSGEVDPSTYASTGDGPLAGTRGYFSPEQLDGAPASELTDQFSFFVTLYEVLVGQLPFGRDSATAVRERIRVREVSLEAIPRRYRRILARGLAEHPGDRYPSMVAVVDALERARHGRARLRRAVVLGAAIVLPTAFAIAANRTEDAEPCAQADAAASDLWSDDGRNALATSFDHAGLSSNSALFLTTVQHFELLEAAWRSGVTSSCEATWISRSQSEATLDLRSGCFEDVREQTRRARALLHEGTREQLVRGGDVVADLAERLKRCDDVAELERRAPPAAIEAEVTALQAEVGLARTLVQAGQAREALDELADIEPSVAALEFGPLRAELLFVRTLAHVFSSDGPRAEETGQQLVDVAEASSMPNILVEGWILLAKAVGDLQSRPGDVEPMFRRADAGLEALGHPLSLSVKREHVHIEILQVEGKFAEALARAERLVERCEREGASADEQRRVLSTKAALLSDAGREEEALRVLDRVQAVLDVSPAASPMMRAKTLHARAISESNTGQLDLALEHLDQAQQLLEGSLGPGPGVASIEATRGALLIDHGRPDDAKTVLLRALELQRASLGEDHFETAATLQNLGGILLEAMQHDEADRYFEQAEDVLVATLGAESPRVAALRANRATIAAHANRPEDARRLCAAALPVLRRHYGPDKAGLGAALMGCGEVHALVGDADLALAAFEEAVETLSKAVAPSAVVTRAWANYGLVPLYRDAGRTDDALRAISRARADCQQVEGSCEHELEDLARWEQQLR